MKMGGEAGRQQRLLSFDPRGAVAQQPWRQVLRHAFPASGGGWRRPVLALPPRGVASSSCPTFPGSVVVRSFRKNRWPVQEPSQCLLS